MNVYDSDFMLLREQSGLTVKETARLLGKSERTIYRWQNGETNPDRKYIEKLKKITDKKLNNIPKDDTKFTFIDLFAGIGGLRRGFESIGGKCVFTSEWDKFCRETYLANFECNHPFAGDIRDIDMEDIPKFDLLLAGFPCQPFSIAGVSKKKSLGQPDGFRCNTQGTLFFEVAQIIEYHRPKAFLLENVRNLVSHDKGNTFKVIMNTLENELKYKVDYKIINAKGFVPQNRERIFIVGFREDVGFSFDNIDIPDPEKGPRLRDILHPEDGSEEVEEPYTIGEKALVNEKYTLSDKLWTYLQDYAEKHRRRGNGFGYGLVGPDDTARTLSARYYKDGSEILIKQENKNPRRLTPRECARLMGFDTDDSKFKTPVSDTQAYKQFGNSVVVPVIERIARHMKPYLTNKVDSNLLYLIK